ncbi:MULTISPECIES: hypothetical protein [Pseudomonas]|uniref:hypothetical protein n=1 Tax=Pseudomonas nitroreducens TaxID=46680 RepID=UPI00147D1B80|nr:MULTISPECIES: hypothetical protein [Pseudomonas]NNN26246.1 hypothetical protein [Pseudomonas nitroreducens]
MIIPVPKNECRPLLDFIEELCATEWRKGAASEYVARQGDQWILRAQIEHPPSVSFRFKREDRSIISRLKSAVENYEGRVRWILDEHKRDGLPGTNWTIGPSRLWEVRDRARELGLAPKQYMAKYEPEFGPVAYEDIIDLTDHIRRAFPEVEAKNPSL